MSETIPALRLAAVERRYRTEAGELPVLRGAELSLQAGEIVALVAPSGTGKSTLLHLAGLLERPDGGEVYVGGRAAGTLSDADRTAIRRTTIGFVYQFHHLLPEFNARENVILPQLVSGAEPGAARTRADQLLGALGLSERLEHRPAKLSGGEQQRVAVARALANKPPLVLADEPTGNLDEHTADIVFGEFLNLVRGEGSAALVATHNERIAAKMDRVVRLHEGRLE
jgi:lipoprotein-releasing system ATP-binding protein